MFSSTPQRRTRANSVSRRDATANKAWVCGWGFGFSWGGAGGCLPSAAAIPWMLLLIGIVIAGIVLLILHFTCVLWPSGSCNSNSGPLINLYPLSANEGQSVQYALFMSQFNQAAFGYGQSLYNESAFIQAGFAPSIYPYLSIMQTQEGDVANTMLDILKMNDFTPNTGCTYTFNLVENNIANYMNFLLTALAYSDGAYINTLNTFNNVDAKRLFAQIGMYESQRHAFLSQWVNGTNYNQPFPTALLAPTFTSSQYFTALTAYFECLDFTLPTLTIQYNGVSLNSTNQSVNTGPISNNTVQAYVNYTVLDFENDLYALNYALAMEQLMYTFYSAFQPIYNATYMEAIGLNQTDVNNFGIMAAHHATAVTDLVTIIVARASAGSNVSPCWGAYNFTMVTNARTYVQTALALEGIVKTGYAGIVNYFIDTVLQNYIAQIGTTIGKHYAYLNQLTGSGYATSTTAFYSAATTPNATVTVLTKNYLNSTCAGLSNIILPTILNVPQNQNYNS